METITTIASIPAILALVNLAKRIAPNLGAASALVAVILGIALSVAAWAFKEAGWYQAASQGLMLGLGAAGLYDLKPPTPPAAASE